MSGHHNFRKLQARIAADPERRTRLESERRLTEAIIELTALREARGATQQQIAEAWDVTQANVSQIEHTPDIYLSTLRNYVAALGGSLEINAVFPDQTIRLLPGVMDRGGADSRDERAAPGAAEALPG
jgi:transcriptional regulator with XRE-family HTH domain